MAHSAMDVCDFFRESIELVGAKRIGLLYADKGFYSRTILEMFPEKGVDFVNAARMTTRLQHEILTVKSWRKDKGMAGLSYGELAYQPTGWPRGIGSSSNAATWIGVRTSEACCSRPMTLVRAIRIEPMGPASVSLRKWWSTSIPSVAVRRI
jgi:hypothetical protein